MDFIEEVIAFNKKIEDDKIAAANPKKKAKEKHKQDGTPEPLNIIKDDSFYTDKE